MSHGLQEYLRRRRAAFKGVITKNTKKAKDIVARNGSRTVIRCVMERMSQAFQDAFQTTKDIITLLCDAVHQRVEAEEWLDQLRSEFEDIVDTIEEFLEHRTDEPPSVFGDFTVDRSIDVDDKASQPSEVSDGSLSASAAEKFAKAEIAALKAKQEKKKVERRIEMARKSSPNQNSKVRRRGRTLEDGSRIIVEMCGFQSKEN